MEVGVGRRPGTSTGCTTESSSPRSSCSSHRGSATLSASTVSCYGTTIRTLPNGAGFSLSFDQDLGGGFVPFLRYGIGDRDVTLVRQSVSGGLGIEGPFGYPGELIGIGAAWADQSLPGVPDETILELFYRVQLTDTVQLTPMIQVLFNPALSDKDVVGVFGARLLMTF